jgi:hypothetical protein
MIGVAILGLAMVISAMYIRRATGHKITALLILSLPLAIISVTSAAGQLLATQNTYLALILSFIVAITSILALLLDPSFCTDVVILVLDKCMARRLAPAMGDSHVLPQWAKKLSIGYTWIIRIFLLLYVIEMCVALWLVNTIVRP